MILTLQIFKSIIDGIVITYYILMINFMIIYL